MNVGFIDNRIEVIKTLYRLHKKLIYNMKLLKSKYIYFEEKHFLS